MSTDNVYLMSRNLYNLRCSSSCLTFSFEMIFCFLHILPSLSEENFLPLESTGRENFDTGGVCLKLQANTPKDYKRAQDSRSEPEIDFPVDEHPADEYEGVHTLADSLKGIALYH